MKNYTVNNCVSSTCRKQAKYRLLPKIEHYLYNDLRSFEIKYLQSSFIDTEIRRISQLSNISYFIFLQTSIKVQFYDIFAKVKVTLLY